MRQFPFIFRKIVVDRQRREGISRAVAERRTDFTSHSENSSALHFSETGEDVGMRCEIGNLQLWRDVFNLERNNAHPYLGGAEFPHGSR